LSEIAIDINADIGIGHRNQRIENYSRVIKYATSVNVAAGVNSDPSLIWAVIKWAKKGEVAVGAHPGFQDNTVFRRTIMNQRDLKADLIYQIGIVDGFAKVEGVKLQHVKPDGLLYTKAQLDDGYAETVVDAVRSYNPELIIITHENSKLAYRARRAGLRVGAEAYIDIKYDAKGHLILERRKKPQDPNTIAKTALDVVFRGKITTTTGKELRLNAKTVCIHSNAPNSPEIIKTVRQTLEKKGVRVTQISNILKR